MLKKNIKKSEVFFIVHTFLIRSIKILRIAEKCWVRWILSLYLDTRTVHVQFCSAKWLWNCLDAFSVSDLHVKQIFPDYLPWKLYLCIFDKWGRWCRSTCGLHHILVVLIFSGRLSEESLTQAVASPGDDAAAGTRLAASSQLCELCSAGRNKKQ